VTDIILDCDPGHDDAIALMLALASPELRLLGVTTVSGNQTLDKTTANAIRVLDHIGRDDVPVAAGAPRPLIRERHVAAEVHGETGLDGPDLPPPAREPEPAHAIDWIAHTLQASTTPVTLVPTGPLTNVALLLTRYAFPSTPSGSAYNSGTSVTSGILLSAVQLAMPVEQGSPFTDSYTIAFPDPGTYRYVCEIHPGMAAYVIVLAQ